MLCLESDSNSIVILNVYSHVFRLKIPEKEYADGLKKQQSQKWAYQWSV